MTLLEMEGLLFEHIANRDAIGKRRARIALFQGMQETLEAGRDYGGDTFNMTWTTDVLAGTNIYQLPEFVGTVLMVERLDQGSNARPLTRIPPLERHNSTLKGTNGYWMDGRNLVLLATASEGLADAIRIKYLPNIVESSDDAYEAPLPKSVHEAIVAKALIRLVARGAKLIDEKGAMLWAQIQERRLINYLCPDGRDAQRPLRAGINFYTPER